MHDSGYQGPVDPARNRIAPGLPALRTGWIGLSGPNHIDSNLGADGVRLAARRCRTRLHGWPPSGLPSEQEHGNVKHGSCKFHRGRMDAIRRNSPVGPAWPGPDRCDGLLRLIAPMRCASVSGPAMGGNGAQPGGGRVATGW